LRNPYRTGSRCFQCFSGWDIRESARCNRDANVENRNTGGRAFTQIRRQALRNIFQKFLADQSGATAIEYGLIAAGIALAIITAVNGLGSTLNTTFSNINTSLK
jgi:pilus assembly protein Flp/PilA